MSYDLEKYAAVWPEAEKWAGRVAREAMEYGEEGEDIELNQTVTTGIIAAALVAERKRCAEVARRAAADFYGNTDSMLAASLIASRIESGQ